MTQFTLLPQMDARNALLCSPTTELKEIALETLRVLDFCPRVSASFQRDLDMAAAEAKKERIVAAAERRDATPALGGLPASTVEDADALSPSSLALKEGRPRELDGEAVAILGMCRAHFGSLTSNRAFDLIRDSVTMNTYFEARGMSMPSRSVMHRWTNCISEASYELLFETHLRMVMEEGLDDMSAVTADSCSVWANTSWPTDSAMILGLLSRAWHYAGKLAALGLPGFSPAYIPLWLDRIRTLDRNVSFSCGKPGSRRKIRRLYTKLCGRADLTLQRLNRQLETLLPTWKEGVASFPYFRRKRAERLLEQVTGDLDDAARVTAYARDRVEENGTVPISEKVLSLSDGSAAYIKKGGREPVIGYKPQLMRSAEGFVTAFELEAGNPNDAARLLPLTLQHIVHTDIVPDEVSVDDGYSSRPNRKALEALGVETISMNGSKGKKITPEKLWDSPAYSEARNKRSAVESLVFTIRNKFYMHRFSRRGIDAVRIEMYEKIIAHNFWRAALLRKRAASAAPPVQDEAA